MTRIRLRTARRTANSATILGVLAAGLLLTYVPLDAQVKTRRFLRPSTTTGDVVYRPQSIVKGLCERLSELDSVVGAIAQTVSLLRERRSGLIAAAVTGKIAVEAAA